MSVWKESVRKALSTRPSGIQVTEIARQTSVPAHRISQFMSKGYINSDDLRTLDNWLLATGIREPEDAPHPAPDADPHLSQDAPTALPGLSLVAARLRLLADTLDSDLDDADKLTEFQKGVDDAIDLFKKCARKLHSAPTP